jgi:3-oxo-5-alpha-steroid 4-dehydrogenase 3 / polyprenol reductase
VVPKSWFTHFYIVGSIVNAFCVAYLSKLASWPCYGAHSILAGILFQLHLARRLGECLFVHTYAPGSTMPLFVYVGGVLHYIVSPLSLVNAADACRHGGDSNPLLRCVSAPVVALGIAIFAASNLLQHVCHRYLASLRTDDKKREDSTATHFLPTWGPFRLVCCPHYTAEIGIYTGLWLICGPASFTPLALAAWTASNLCVTGVRTLGWYKMTFGPEKTAHWKAVFPGLV